MDWLDILVGGTRARLLRLLRASTRTIAEMAAAVGISGNAVRAHLSALQADGLARDVGTAPSTGGKPAHVYDITPEGEELFPRAYACVLRELIVALQERDGREHTLELLRDVGRRAAGSAATEGMGVEARVAAAAAALRSIGGDAVVVRVEDGWEIRAVGCPLSSVVQAEPDTCAIARGLIAAASGEDVVEFCDRTQGRSRCRFRVISEPGAGLEAAG